MPFYLQTYDSCIDSNPLLGVWDVGATSAHRIDVTDSELGRFNAAPGTNALETLRDSFPGARFHQLDLEPGQYYPRMARPVLNLSLGRNPDDSDSAKHRRASATGQLHALIQQLEHICRVVQPVELNFQTFGHEIRNILILACTEVEAQWKGILKANGVAGDRTKDYVKLASPLKLSEYAVELPYYPWMPAIRPFERWHSSTTVPTKDIQWYNAYNAVKHNRDENFQQASLFHAFQALVALFIMLCAQYGWDFALTGEAATRSFFCLKEGPRWRYSEYYVPPYVGKLRDRMYSFPAHSP
jgi:hypothetical protein